jgi:hypothetical protein
LDPGQKKKKNKWLEAQVALEALENAFSSTSNHLSITFSILKKKYHF